MILSVCQAVRYNSEPVKIPATHSFIWGERDKEKNPSKSVVKYLHIVFICNLIITIYKLL